MEKIEYPKWKYHATEQPVVVESAEQEEALGKEWADSPAAFEKKAAPATPAKGK